MVLWVISVGGGAGGKVCHGAQSVQLALGGVRRSPGRADGWEERGVRLQLLATAPRRPPPRGDEVPIDIFSGKLMWQFLCKCLDTAV